MSGYREFSAHRSRVASRRRLGVATLTLLLIGIALAVASSGLAAPPTFIGPMNGIQTIASTVPKNGYVNPYGVAVVPASVGHLVAGDVLVSNFNNHRNLQGTGTTIVQISPSREARVCSRRSNRTSCRASVPVGSD